MKSGGGVIPGSLLLLDEFRLEMFGIRNLCLFVVEDDTDEDASRSGSAAVVFALLTTSDDGLLSRDWFDIEADVSFVANDLSNGLGSKSNVVFS